MLLSANIKARNGLKTTFFSSLMLSEVTCKLLLVSRHEGTDNIPSRDVIRGLLST
jgi:hypothetical protein